jgi:hypothetical protein
MIYKTKSNIFVEFTGDNQLAYESDAVGPISKFQVNNSGKIIHSN